MHNIRYGRLDATNAEAVEAARRANVHATIERLTEGYRETVESGKYPKSQNFVRELIANGS